MALTTPVMATTVTGRSSTFTGVRVGTSATTRKAQLNSHLRLLPFIPAPFRLSQTRHTTLQIYAFSRPGSGPADQPEDKDLRSSDAADGSSGTSNLPGLPDSVYPPSTSSPIWVTGNPLGAADRAADASPSVIGGGDGPNEDTGHSPLTLGSDVLERMAKLRALDQYRNLLTELAEAEAAAAAAVRQSQRRPGSSSSSSAAAAAAAASSAGDDSAAMLRGALLIARHRYPSLDEQRVYDTLDELSRRVSALLPREPGERYPLRVVAAINRVLYHDYGFRGNEEDYYDASNSCINLVLERRKGIPITLALVYSEVARRVGLPMRGVNLPGHFMLQPVRTALRGQG
ncbi:hypothetical protein Agub_g7235, partial [Astrephomene gubernaculifera]